MTANHRPLEEGDIELIERIRASPCLYDIKNPDFRLVYKKEQQWQTIAEGLAMSHWEARKRWTVLRDRYARELKQLLLHPDSMQYGKNEFFHRMDFLRSHVKKRSLRKRCYNSLSNVKTRTQLKEEDDEESMVRPIKIFKVDSNFSSFNSNERVNQQQRKSYIIDDSQDSTTTGRFTYIEQEDNDIIEPDHEGDSSQQLEDHCVAEQEYNNFVEGN